MKKELEEQLVKKYPKLFQDYGGDMSQTCMAWGCSHGDGWYGILDELCSELVKYDVVLAQVKEKFGTLRVYINGGNGDNWEEIHDIISKAERASSKTCEHCGGEGELNSDGYWWRTTCGPCDKEREGKILDK